MIRKATRQDIPAIRLLMQSVPEFWQQSWRRDVLERGIDSADGLAFVWEEGAAVVGFVCAHDVGFRGYLSELVVAEHSRAKGIGKQLVECVQRELVERGCSMLIADIWRNAEPFYRGLGWRPPEAILLGRKLF